MREPHRTVRIKDKRVGLRLLLLKKRQSVLFVLQPVPDEKGRARLQPLRDMLGLRPEIIPQPVEFDLRKDLLLRHPPLADFATDRIGGHAFRFAQGEMDRLAATAAILKQVR